MTAPSPIGLTGAVVIGIYLLSLLIIGWLGQRARRESTLADFYLAGRSMGLVTLFLTLYATQYSGNTFVGFAAATYRQGFLFLVSVTFMMGIVGIYWLYASRLHALSHKHSYITPGDFIHDRYDSHVLTLLVNLILIATLSNYILVNLKAIGHVVEVMSGGLVPFVVGIIALSLIMVVYESLGGMRSVAWTDAIQGLLLLAGCSVIAGALVYRYGGLPAVISQLEAVRPEFWSPPDTPQKLSWLSVLLLVAFGGAVYPQALQRIYAARDGKTLRRSLQVMVLMPLFTTLFALTIGIVGAAEFPGLTRVGSEQITLLVLSDVTAAIPQLKIVLILLIAAIVAAIMSTVDSALLTISSIFTQDFYRPLRPSASQAHLASTGKVLSWLLMAVLAYLAIALPQTIWKLTVLKFELLVQVAPAILLGVYMRRPLSAALALGVVTGLVVALVLTFADNLGITISTRPLGIHAGVWGLLANVTVLGLFTLLRGRKANR